jgi:hypothetical protein
MMEGRNEAWKYEESLKGQHTIHHSCFIVIVNGYGYVSDFLEYYTDSKVESIGFLIFNDGERV